MGEFDLVLKTLSFSFRAASMATRGGVMVAQAAAASRQGTQHAAATSSGASGSSWLAGLRYRQPRPTLGPEQHVVAPDGSYSFGLPWPWESLPVGALEDGTSGAPLAAEDRPDVAVTAPRTDGLECLFTTHRLDGPVDVESLELGRELSLLALRHQAHPGRPRRIKLCGARAVILPVTGAVEEHHLLIASAGARGLTGTLRVPTAHAQAYLWQFETLLGSWQWLR